MRDVPDYLPETSQFDVLMQQQAEKKLPPVSSWNPARRGSIDVRIDRNGRWFHDGSEIHRKELVKLFGSILRYEKGHYFLVTPAEKLAIEVEDAPFLIVDMEIRESPEGVEIGFLTSMQDFVVIDEAHPLSMREGRPYVVVRDGLTALIARSVYYHLVELAVPSPEHDGNMGVYSRGVFFKLGKEA